MASPAEFFTPDRIIRSAMTDAGLLQEGDSPTSDQYANYSDRLNDVINVSMIKPGCKLWVMSDIAIPLTAGKATYVLAPQGDVSMAKPYRVDNGYYLDVNNTRTPLHPIAWEDWTRLSNVVQQGQITQYFVDKQVGQLNISFWRAPDANAAKGTAHLIIRSQVTNFTGIADSMQFPQEWFMYLRWALADDICTGQPQTIMDRCAQKAQMYYDILTNWDVEDAPMRFEPDHRVGVEGRFM